MGHRLSKIYTRTGDDGTTGLGDGTRVAKDSFRMDAIGNIDELNCLIGLLLASDPPTEMRDCLTDVQHDLFDLGGELSIPGHTLIRAERSSALEQVLDRFNAGLPPLKEFILPGGSRAAAVCHLARAVCRRAERSVVRLNRHEPVSDEARMYLNRLSDLLFVLARVAARATGTEAMWQRGR
ncbi:MAG: cob(I)yrinic acid a,c-diamide adenosyltransferase [Gammaproteobacteria bacterium]